MLLCYYEITNTFHNNKVTQQTSCTQSCGGEGLPLRITKGLESTMLLTIGRDYTINKLC